MPRLSRRTALALPSLLAPVALQAADEYPLGPDHERKPGVPKGTVTKHSWTSTIFPGTVRDYWVYVPAQYQAGTPASLIVFQDGGGFVAEDGRWRAPVVLDNLIHKRELPLTVAVFVNPGVLPAQGDMQQSRFNRSYEYDGLGDRYARFLIEELLPEVGKRVTLSSDPNDRAICGSSSGAIAAFTAAWNRPDAFRRVVSFIGSYTNLRGGHVYPSLIRKTEPKPLRVYLQDGRADSNIYAGNWFIGNQDMASALEYAGYDVTFVVGSEGHNNRHGSAVLPDALRWVWREHPKPIVASRKSGDRQFVTMILDPAQEWELVSQGHRFTEGPAAHRDGNVFFTDIPNNRIHRIGVDGRVSVFKEESGGANGLMVGPDGRLYACQNGKKRIVAYNMEGVEAVIAEEVSCNDLAVTAKGEMYFTDPQNKRVWFVDAKGAKRMVHEGIQFPNGVVLSPDQSLLMVADSSTPWVWSFQVLADGSLANGQPFYRLEMPDSPEPGAYRSGADGMTVDTEGHLYVTTKVGIQVCDQPGRVVGIISKPQPADPSNVCFGGKELQTLYVTARDKVYRRRVRRTGAVSWGVMKPPVPRL